MFNWINKKIEKEFNIKTIDVATIITKTIIGNFKDLEVDKQQIIELFKGNKSYSIDKQTQRMIFQIFKAIVLTFSWTENIIFEDILVIFNKMKNKKYNFER